MKNTHPTKTAAIIAEAVELFDACRHEEAIARLNRYRAEAGCLTPEDTLAVNNNLATFWYELNRFDEALRIHRESAPLADDENIDPRRRGQFHNGYATTLHALGDHDGALIEFAGASVRYNEAGEHRLRANVHNNIAVVLTELGRFDEALDHLARSLGSCPADEAVITQVEDTHALVALAQGDPERAVDISRKAEARARRLGNERLIRMCLKTSMRAEAAVLHAEEAKDILAALERCGWNLTHVARAMHYNSREAFKHRLRRHFPEIDELRRNRIVPVKKGE
jgi:tetratricopeptide (TPR) repeat protein